MVNAYLVNDDGQIFDGVLQIGTPKRPKQNADFSIVFSEGLDYLANVNLSTSDFRVLLGLLRHADFDNRCFCSYSYVASLLLMKPSNFTRSITRLREADVVRLMCSLGGQRFIMLNPCLFWRGSVKSHRTALRLWAESGVNESDEEE